MSEAPNPIDETELLPTRIKRYLIEQIVTGELTPGERIVESRLAKSLGTSQSPVREALRDLAAIGLVEIIPHRGSTVRSPDAKELADVSLLRSILDALAAELAASRVDADRLGELERLLNDMRAASEAGDRTEFARVDAGFHEVIAEASGNRPLQRVLHQLEPFGRTYLTVMRPETDLEEIIADHEAILEALQAQNPIGAASAAGEHQRRVSAQLLTSVAEPGVEVPE